MNTVIDIPTKLQAQDIYIDYFDWHSNQFV